MNRVTLITGGGRSGKSRYALELAGPGPGRVFIATAEASDDEMRARILHHRAERGPQFHTLEEPLDLVGALRRLPPGTRVAVVDCLTLWLSNLMQRGGAPEECLEMRAFLEVLDAPPVDLVLVTNEVGLGIIPATELGRAFRDLAGRLNQEVARRAGTVILMVCGLPVFIKKESPA